MTPKRLGRTLLWALGIPAVVALVLGAVNRDRLLTMASLRQVDDHPLYVMTYHGDYGFSEYLQTGRRPGLARSEPEMARWACTCFAALGAASDCLFGRNFDWHNLPTMLLFTDPPDGYAAMTMVDISYLGYERGAGPRPAWLGRNSLLWAPYLAFDGMNEHGLAVGIMAVPDVNPPYDPSKVAIDSLAANRLMLDRARNVDEAVGLLRGYNIQFLGGPPLHYLLADATGQSVIVEFQDRQMIVLPNREPWQVSTNYTFAGLPPQGADSSCWRYNLVYEALQKAQGRIPVSEGMALLRGASQDSTKWSAVYNLNQGDMILALGRRYERIHRFELDGRRHSLAGD